MKGFFGELPFKIGLLPVVIPPLKPPVVLVSLSYFICENDWIVFYRLILSLTVFCFFLVQCIFCTPPGLRKLFGNSNFALHELNGRPADSQSFCFYAGLVSFQHNRNGSGFFSFHHSFSSPIFIRDVKIFSFFFFPYLTLPSFHRFY